MSHQTENNNQRHINDKSGTMLQFAPTSWNGEDQPRPSMRVPSYIKARDKPQQLFYFQQHLLITPPKILKRRNENDKRSYIQTNFSTYNCDKIHGVILHEKIRTLCY